MRTTRTIAGLAAVVLATIALAACAANPTGSARGTASVFLESLGKADLDSALALIDPRSEVIPSDAEVLPSEELAAAMPSFTSFEIIDERVDQDAGVGRVVAGVSGGTLEAPLEIELVKGGPNGDTWLVSGLSTSFPRFRIIGAEHLTGTLPGGTVIDGAVEVIYYGLPGMELDVRWTDVDGFYEAANGLVAPSIDDLVPTTKLQDLAVSELTSALEEAMALHIASADPTFVRVTAEPEVISIVPSGAPRHDYEVSFAPGAFQRCTNNFSTPWLDEAPLFGDLGPIRFAYDPYTGVKADELVRYGTDFSRLLPLSMCGV